MTGRFRRAALGCAVSLALAACSNGSPQGPGSATSPAGPGASPRQVGTFAADLAAPWSMAVLPDRSVLVTHRDDATVSRIDRAGARETVGRIEGVVPGGEGGLLGIAVPDGDRPRAAFVYYTAADGNRIARLDWDGRRLGAQTAILTGIPKAAIHDGGRLAFGPDGFLYAGTGDSGTGDLAQDRGSLAGKILRITQDGRPAPGNPEPDSPVWTWGHRNVQGLAWDDDDRLWATEFGASDVDELNLIEKGRNYGWPECEGSCSREGFTDPAVEWSPTSVASPSGLAIASGSAWVASLRGEVLWQVPLDGDSAGAPLAWFGGEFGRLRDVVTDPSGELLVMTNNTDGRGTPRSGDDRILVVAP